MLGARSVGGDVGEVDVGLGGRRELDLGLLGGLANTLDRHAVLGKIESRLLLELGDDVVDELDVKVLSSEVGVSVGRLDLEDTVLHLEDRDIKGSSSEIVDGDQASVGAVESVSEGGGGGLVDDAENVESGDGSGVLGGLTLGVVEVGGNGNDWEERKADSSAPGLLRYAQLDSPACLTVRPR